MEIAEVLEPGYNRADQAEGERRSRSMKMSSRLLSLEEVRKVATFSAIMKVHQHPARKLRERKRIAFRAAHLAHLKLCTSYRLAVCHADIAEKRWVSDD